MRVVVTESSVDVLLARWEKVLGLLRDIHVPIAEVSDVRVVANPVREAMLVRFKFGLRVPWFYYVARTIRLDQAFVVRRGVPGLSFAVRNSGPLARVLVSAPDAEEFARKLRSARPTAAPPAAPAAPAPPA